MLPGLIRTAATPASIARSARLALKWMSAMTGIGERRTILFSASASSIFGTAQRTPPQPADASAAICAVVAVTSRVGVSVIDWTTTGAPPPIWALPTLTLYSDPTGPSLASPGSPSDVVGEADEEQHEDERDSDDRDALVDLAADGAPADALDDRERDVAAVERKQRQEVQQRQREADEPEHPEVGLQPPVERVRRAADDANRARDLLSAGALDEAAEHAADLLRDQPGQAERLSNGRGHGKVLELRAEAEPVRAVGVLERARRAEHHELSLPVDRDAERAALGLRDLPEHPRGVDLLAVDRDDPVAAAKAHLFGRRRNAGPDLRLDECNRRRRPPRPEDEQEREHRDREEEVRARPGADHEHLLPCALAPVGIPAETVSDLGHPALDVLAGRRGDVGLLGRPLERLQRPSRGVEVSVREQPLRALDRPDELWRLLDRPPEVRVHLGRCRAVHAGDLRVAAERDRPDPVLDSAPAHLGERGREADVELARPHPHEARGVEVARLVHEDQKGETDDRDQVVHAATSPFSATLLASASASMSSSTSAAGSPETVSSVRSTTSAIPRNGSRPARKAATATSFAALKAHGDVPPRSPARRARPSNGNASASTGSNSSTSPDVKSNCGTSVGPR